MSALWHVQPLIKTLKPLDHLATANYLWRGAKYTLWVRVASVARILFWVILRLPRSEICLI